MSHEFVGTQHGIGVSFFLVIAPPGRGPQSRLRHFLCPVEKRRPRHPGPEVSQVTVRETGGNCPESANSPSTVAPDYWRKPRFHEHRRRLRAADASLVLYRRRALVLNSPTRGLLGAAAKLYRDSSLSAPQSGTQRKHAAFLWKSPHLRRFRRQTGVEKVSRGTPQPSFQAFFWAPNGTHAFQSWEALRSLCRLSLDNN
jgi:hypothetical protein